MWNSRKFRQINRMFRRQFSLEESLKRDKTHPIIHTSHGLVRGSLRKTVYGDEYYSFEKIPFAKPPLGDLRFKDPVPVEPWEEVINGLTSNVSPLQIDWYTKCITGTEDCLYLNVYTKKLESEERLPIMFYIYGGAFYLGAANQEILGPDYFMMEDVILVTANYRLGPLGFMWFKDPKLKIPGNAGIKDQLMALKWIKQNAIAFNGNPLNITVFGQSAGGTSAHLLMATPCTKKLFQRAIIMSGTVLNHWAFVPTTNYPYMMAVATGYKGPEIDKDVLKHLLDVSGDTLMTIKVRTLDDLMKGAYYIWGPIIEPYESSDSILTQNIDEMLHSSWSNHIPIMIGGTSDEAILDIKTIRKCVDMIAIIEKDPQYLIPYQIRRNLTEEEIAVACTKMQCIFRNRDYFPNIHSMVDICTYTNYWVGFLRTVVQRLRDATSASTYLYRFDYDSDKFNLYRRKYCGDNIRGVAHADDVSYLFYCKEAWELPKDSDDYRTIRRMVCMWTSFARNSNPNCTEIEPTKWRPITSEQPFQVLNIDREIEMLPVLPNGKKWSFWLKLYKEYPITTKSTSTSISSLPQAPPDDSDKKKCSDECF